MKKNLLLIMPFFLDYHRVLCEKLSQSYHVTLFNSEQYLQEIMAFFYAPNIIRRNIRKLAPALYQKDYERACDTILERPEIKAVLSAKYDIIFCINGYYLPNAFYQEIMQNNPEARTIYYAWDDFSNMTKTTQVGLFHDLYSFNVDDCRQMNMKYVPMFVQVEEEQPHEDLYDLSFIATVHSDRKKIAEKLKQKYGKDYKLFIYLYDTSGTEQGDIHARPLSYNEYIRVLSQSRCTLEVPAEKQQGPTTRIFDSLMTKTKVITSNREVMKYPVWSSNILVIDRETLDIDPEFIRKPYEETGYQALTLSKWIREFDL